MSFSSAPPLRRARQCRIGLIFTTRKRSPRFHRRGRDMTTSSTPCVEQRQKRHTYSIIILTFLSRIYPDIDCPSTLKNIHHEHPKLPFLALDSEHEYVVWICSEDISKFPRGQDEKNSSCLRCKLDVTTARAFSRLCTLNLHRPMYVVATPIGVQQQIQQA